MSDSDWVDVGSSSQDDWQDVTSNAAPAPPMSFWDTVKNEGNAAANSFLQGGANVLGLGADVLTNTADAFLPGDQAHWGGGSEYLTGLLKDSGAMTEAKPVTLPGEAVSKFAEYLPGGFLGPGSMALKLGTTALSAGGGLLGSKLGGPTGELIGSIAAPASYNGLTKLASGTGSALQGAGDALELNAFGVTATDLKKAAAKNGKGYIASLKENPYKTAITDFRQSGGPAESMAGSDLVNSAEKQNFDLSKQLRSEIGKADSAANATLAEANAAIDELAQKRDALLKTADESGSFIERENAKWLAQRAQEQIDSATTNLGSIEAPVQNVPQYTKTAEVVAGLSELEKETGKRIAANAISKYEKTLDGSLGALQDEKVALGNTINWETKNPTVKDKVLKGIYNDFKTTIEQKVEALSPSANKDTISGINKQIGNRKLLLPNFNKIKNKEAATDPITKTINFIKTTGGYGTLIGTGARVAGKLGAAIGAGSGLLMSKAGTPSGRLLLSDLARSTGKSLTKASKAAAIPGITTAPLSALEGFLSSPTSQTSSPKLSASKTNMSDTKAPNAKLTKLAVNELIQKQPTLVQAVIHQESGKNPAATSSKGAQGLMQIMPVIAKAYGAKDPYDPVQNLNAGTKFLTYLQDKYDDDKLALAAYNLGETKLDKLLKGSKVKSFEAIKNSLPQETRDYVPSVLARKALLEV